MVFCVFLIVLNCVIFRIGQKRNWKLNLESHDSWLEYYLCQCFMPLIPSGMKTWIAQFSIKLQGSPVFSSTYWFKQWPLFIPCSSVWPGYHLGIILFKWLKLFFPRGMPAVSDRLVTFYIMIQYTLVITTSDITT